MENLEIAYSYARDHTNGSTGYFSCEPSPQPSLAEALKVLGEQPLDVFLRRHLLRRLCGTEEMECKNLAEPCLAGNENQANPLAALLLECAALSPDCRKILSPLLAELRKLVQPLEAATPLPILRGDQDANPQAAEKWSAIFAANIHAHKALPDKMLQNLPPLYEEDDIGAELAAIEAERGLLASLRSNISPKTGQERKDPKETWQTALSALEKAGLLAGPEMRHEASLSPIALLRDWRLEARVNLGRARHAIAGTATAYGRGLSLAGARASCLMEIVERASAHASFANGGQWNQGKVENRLRESSLLFASPADLSRQGSAAIKPELLCGRKNLDHIPFHWIAGMDSQGKTVFAPCQAVFLFCNLDEPEFFTNAGSSGLASGNTLTEARLAALVEVLEREAHAAAPFSPESCFRLTSRDSRIRGLLEDYLARGIYIQFQDISLANGFPVYRCFITAKDGSVAQATGGGLSGPRAAISALTEVPWPYAYSRQAPYGQPTGRGLPDLPWRFLEDLPDFSLPNVEAELELLQNVLQAQNRQAVYVDISREDLRLPVARTIIPGANVDAEFSLQNPPSLRLLANAEKLRRDSGAGK